MYRRIKNLMPSPAIVGRIKIGGLGELRTSARGKEWRPPVKYDHFVVTTTQRDEKSGNFIADAEIMQKLGEKPRELDVMVLDDDIEEVFLTSFGLYAGKTCACRGDGETAERRETLYKLAGPEDRPGPLVPEPEQAKLRERMTKGDWGNWIATVCPPDICRYFTERDASKPRCRAIGRLYVVLPYRPQLGGVWLFTTSSLEMIRSITYTLEEIRTRTNGILAGIPLKLRLYQKTDALETGGQVTNWKVGLFFDPGTQRLHEALGEAAHRVAALRAAALVDQKALAAERRRALRAADAQVLEQEVLVRPDEDAEPMPTGPEATAGFHGVTPNGHEAAPARSQEPEPAAVGASAGPTEQTAIPF